MLQDFIAVHHPILQLNIDLLNVAGFNCGEAANFATPQWLKFAKEAAVRRAAMNFLPMLSHQQLLYLLAISFISRFALFVIPFVFFSQILIFLNQTCAHM